MDSITLRLPCSYRINLVNIWQIKSSNRTELNLSNVSQYGAHRALPIDSSCCHFRVLFTIAPNRALVAVVAWTRRVCQDRNRQRAPRQHCAACVPLAASRAPRSMSWFEFIDWLARCWRYDDLVLTSNTRGAFINLLFFNSCRRRERSTSNAARN